MEVENKIDENDFFIVKTSIGKEDKLMIDLTNMIKRKEFCDTFFSVFKPDRVDGYIFVETKKEEDSTNLTRLKDILRNVPNTRGIINKPLDFSQIERYFKKDVKREQVNEKDIVEIISGPFKGEKARVTRVILGKDEVIIEHLNTPIAIPITLNIDDIRVVKE